MKAALRHMHVPSYFAFVTVWIPDSDYLCLVSDFCMHYFLDQKKEREGLCCFNELILAEGTWDISGAKMGFCC